MKYKFIILAIFFGTLVSAQNGANRFSDTENTVKEEQVVAIDDGPGDPPGPVPINDYIPLLLLAAVGLIIYQVRKQKQSVNWYENPIYSGFFYSCV